MKTTNKFNKTNDKEVWHSENIYHLKTDISRMGKFIYHYEIYKKIVDIPGDILEFGVFKGISLTRFLTFRSLLENNFSRKVYGFDNFGYFPKVKSKVDNSFITKWQSNTGFGIDINELDEIFKTKGFQNYELIKGNVFKTLDLFLKKNNNLKISLLHLDMDVYDPTKFVLNKLLKYMSKGGIILIDDYNGVEGATRAVDQFLRKKNNLKLKKLTFYKLPSFIEIK
jgi:hypothetical protein